MAHLSPVRNTRSPVFSRPLPSSSTRFAPTERDALLAGDVAALYRMGVNSFLMGYLCGFEVCGLTLEIYNSSIRSAAPQGH